MKYIKILSSVVLVSVTTSCTITKTVTLTPVSGNIAKKGITNIPAKFTWDGSGSGAVEVQMPDGEICKGRYSTIVRGSNSYSSGQSYSNYSTYGYSPYNIGVYGSSSYSGRGRSYRNEQRGRAMATSDRGRVITLDYVTSANNPTHGHGRGFDNKGNTYNIVY